MTRRQPGSAVARRGRSRRAWPLLLLCLTCPLAAQIDDEDPEVLEARLQALREQIVGIQGRIEADRTDRDAEREALAGIERDIGRLGRQLRETEGELVSVQAELQTLLGRERELEGELAGEQYELGTQLRAAHRLGSRSRLRLLFSQDEPARLGRVLAYHAYMTRARVALIDRVAEQLRDLLAVRAGIEARQARLDQLLSGQREDIRQREAAREQRAATVAAIDARIEGSQAELARMQADAEELQRLIDELSQALADIPPEVDVPALSSLRGQLAMPAQGPVRARFGQRRSAEVIWTGWLIGATEGSEVTSVGHGRVAFADWLRGYGLVMIIDHGEGYMSLYAHNESLLFDVGDWVRPGQVIATVGNSGGESQAGLYFELRSQGQAVDPAPWIAR